MLAAVSGQETGRLRHLVANAAGCNSEGMTRSDGEIAITCPSGAPPLVLRIKAIPHSAIDKGGKHKQVVAIFTGTSEMMETARQLYDFYHFTPAEARLAALIVSGHSLHTAARKLCVSQNTARTHMKRIYDQDRDTSASRSHPSRGKSRYAAALICSAAFGTTQLFNERDQALSFCTCCGRADARAIGSRPCAASSSSRRITLGSSALRSFRSCAMRMFRLTQRGLGIATERFDELPQLGHLVSWSHSLIGRNCSERTAGTH